MAPPRSIPRFRNKWRHPSLVTPADFMRRYNPGFRAPERCVVVWNPRLAATLARRFGGRRVSPNAPIFTLPGPARVGIVYPRGIGAPGTVSQCEELAAAGTREFVGIGAAGGLATDLAPGAVVVCDSAVRDEGTSHHYAPPHVPAVPSPTLRRWLERALATAKIPFRVGPSWTLDAPYRETRAELRHYRAHGVLTVEMEASAMFLFGRGRRVRVASVFVVSDRLTDDGWDLHFDKVPDWLETVGSAVVRSWIDSHRPRGGRGPVDAR